MRSAVKFALFVSALGVGSALTAQGSALAMLAKLERGQWTISMRDGGPSRSLCIGDPVKLLQLRHPSNARCSRVVVEDTPGKVTVQYTCRGNGYGRTTIRRESNTLVQIESQGVANGRPFDFSAEARRTGACP